MSAPAEPAALAGEATAPAAPRRGRLFVKYVVSLVGLVAVLLIGNGALDVWFSYNEAKQTLVRIQQEKAEAAAQRIAEFVDEIERQIGWTTHAQWSAGTVDQRRFDYVRLLRQVPAITELAQLDSEGKEQLKVSRLAMDVVGSGTDYSQDPKFTQAVAHKVWFSPVYFRKESEPYMTIAVAHAGRKPGVTVADVNLKLIWDVVSAIKVGQAGYAYVVGPDGRLIAHPDISLVLRDTDLSGLPQVAAALANPGTAANSAANVTIAPNAAGVSVLTAHAAIPALNWLVFVELPASEALAPLYQLLTRSGILLGVGLLLAAVAGGLLARRMVVPIRRLQEGAERLGAGELDHRIEVKTGDEIEALADRFNRMGAQLQDSYATLEAKVEARTHDLAEALEYQTATSEVLRIVASSPDHLQPVFDAMLDKATELCGAKFGMLLLYDGEMYNTVAVRNLPAAVAEIFGSRPLRPQPTTASGRVLKTKQPIAITDLRQDIAYMERDPMRVALVELGGARGQLVVPLLKKGDVIGCFLIYVTEPRPFAENEIALVSNFADQAVIAIENARLLGELRTRNADLADALDRQTATSEVLRAISQSPADTQPVFDAIAASAQRLCEGDFGVVIRFDGELAHLMALHGGAPDEFVPLRAAFPSKPVGLLAEALEQRTVVHAPDIASDPRSRLRQTVVSAGGRAFVFVPMLREGSAIGAILVMRRQPHAFTDAQIELLKTFADQAVIAIENARLLGELRTRNSDLAEALEFQTATSEVLRIVATSPDDLQPVFDAMLEKATELCEAKFGALLLYDGEIYRAVATKNMPPALATMFGDAHRPEPNTATARVLKTKQPIAIEDLRQDIAYIERRPLRTALVEQGGARAQLVVPLLKKGDVIGAFLIYLPEPRPFADSQVALVTTFADQAVIAIENARLISETREALEQQTATAEVLHVIARSPGDLKPVFQAMLENATRVCDAKFGVLQLYEDGGFRIGAIHNAPPAFAEAMARREALMRPTPQHPFRRMVTTKVVVQIADLMESPAYKERDPGIVMLVERASARTFLAVPMLKEDEVVGVIAIYRQEVRAFTDKQIAVVVNFANQAVIAIENIRLLNELRERTDELARSVDELTATSDVLKIISRSAVDLTTVLDTLVETAARLCRADQAYMFRRGADELLHLIASSGVSEEGRAFFHAHPFAADRGTTPGRAALERRAIHIPDVLTDADYTYTDGQRAAGYRTTLGVPLLRQDTLIGVFGLARANVDPFTDKEVELVTTFADQAVIAIENARLFEELRERSAELARSVEELTTLREVGQAVSSTLDLGTVLETIVARAVALAGAEAGAIYRYRKADRQFRLGTCFGLDEALVAKIRQEPIREAETLSLARAIQERAPAQIDLESARHLPLRDLMVAAGFRSALQVPLVGADRVFGVLSIQKKTVGEFPESTVKMMQTFASQSVLAIQNARLFREVEEQGRALALASQHKSQFLANMSHELRTPLNAVLGYAELLADGIYGELGEKARGVLERIQSNGKHLLGLINDVLDLSKIEAGQLTLAIDDYAMPAVVHSVVSATESLAKAKGLSLVTSVPRALPTARGDERRLTQVLLNLVGNAIKFTDKGSVGIEVTVANDRFELAVKDTGPGIAKADQARIFEEFQQVDNSNTRQKGGTGLGLAISKRIVELHGGTLTVDSEPGKGSTFRVTVPVQVEPAKEVA